MAYWKDKHVMKNKKPKENFTPLEEEEQKVFIEWCKMMENKYKGLELIHAIPNGGSRNEIEARNLKLTGVKAGVPDLFLPVARNGKHGLYIEMKRKKGGRVSEFQKDWLAKLTDQGYETAVCYGAEEAIKTIEEYYSTRGML